MRKSGSRFVGSTVGTQWSVDEFVGSGEIVYKKRLARRHTRKTSFTGKSLSCAVGIEKKSQATHAGARTHILVGPGLRTRPLAGRAPGG